MEKQKQNKAAKRLYAKMRHSKKQAKAATRQGGYWRDIAGEVNPQFRERQIVQPTLRHADSTRVWIRPDGKELHQQEYRVAESLSQIVKSWQYDRQAEKSTEQKERDLIGQAFLMGLMPSFSLKHCTLYKQSAERWLALRLARHHSGNSAAATAERERAKRLLKQWAGVDKASDLQIALALLHGAEAAIQISERLSMITKGLRVVDDGSERVDHNIGYSENKNALHAMARTDDGQSYAHCREADNTMYGFISFFAAALRK